MYLRFNRNPITIGRTIEQPSQDVVKNTMSLWGASLEDAVKYGGELTRNALSAMNLRGDKKHIIVDTKVHMLMPGFIPAIPSWHTDGTPRDKTANPQVKSPPRLWEQNNYDSPRFHLLVTDGGCLTEFINEPTGVPIPYEPDPQAFSIMHKSIDEQHKNFEITSVQAPSCQVVEFDWWNIHRGVVATRHEWRFLIRVTETDFQQPERELRNIIRTQQQVYTPIDSSW